MYNIFTTDDLDGIISAAYYHAVARRGKAGIHVTYCKPQEVLEKVEALFSTISMAKSMGIRQPDARFLVISGLNVSSEINAEISLLTGELASICPMIEDHVPFKWFNRILYHIYILLCQMAKKRENGVFGLSEHFFNQMC